MAALQHLTKPYYLFRPDQVLRHLIAARIARGRAETFAVTAWGMPLLVSPRDQMGSSIIRTGVLELPVTEAMWRLTRPDDLAFDVGANIGYFTALLARRAAAVVALEPHPRLAGRLWTSVVVWRRGIWSVEASRVGLVEKAASDGDGVATLNIPPDFEANEGQASLGAVAGAATSIAVETVKLDTLIGDRHIGVLKIDIEGHELPAFRGAERALTDRRIRDVFFEELAPLPTPASEFLTERGYEIFGLREQVRGPQLVTPDQVATRWHAPTYVATASPDRARRLLGSRGWRSLRPVIPALF